MNNQLTLGEYISQVFFKETGQDKLVLAINMDLTLEQVSLLLIDKLELNTHDVLRLSKILPIYLAEIHSRLLLTYQHQSTLQVMCHIERDKILLEHQIKHTLNSATNNICLCEPLTILQLLNDNITVTYLKFGHSISFDVDVEGNKFYITTQYSVKNSYNRAVEFTSTFTPNRSYADCLLIAHRNKHIDFSETAKKHNALNTFILDVYINRHKLHVDSLLHVFGCNRTKLNKFIEGNLKLDTSELIALQDTVSIPFELLKDLQMSAGGKETLNDNKQQDMKMNKTDTEIKAFLDEMGDLLSDDQKKEIQEHIERHERAKLIKDAKKTLDNAMKAMHLSKNEEAKRSANVQYFDAVLGYMNNRLDSSIASNKDLVEKRREEELVKSISKVKTLIKEDTITINKLTDKRVNLTANLFNLEDKLTKLRNSSKTKS